LTEVYERSSALCVATVSFYDGTMTCIHPSKDVVWMCLAGGKRGMRSDDHLKSHSISAWPLSTHWYTKLLHLYSPL